MTVADIKAHLKDRGIDAEKTAVIVDRESNIATFLLYNLSGQLVGYQEYNPNEEKVRGNAGRYFNYVSREDKYPKLAVWGVDTIGNTQELFIVEGIFDAAKLHNAGKSAVAVLTNNPVHLKSWFAALPYKIIAITDNDSAGTQLKKYADAVYTVPDPYKDLGEMPQEEVNMFVERIVPSTKEQKVLAFLSNLVKGTEYDGKVFLAGGAVRDEIMQQPVKDIDLVVSMDDGGIKFANWVTKKLGRYKEGANPVVFPRFGTAKFNLQHIKSGNDDLSGVDIEVVMTRGEKYEKGSRKPEVVYADLKDDALRRDLTVNSLFKDIVTGEIKDLTGMGIDDIKRGVVRTPQDPAVAFQDDPLRMLRAIRFATKYDWKMSSRIVPALVKHAHLLDTISKERIRDEFNKILLTNQPDIGIRLLTKTGLMQYIIPELDTCIGVTQNVHHKDDVYNHILEVVKNTTGNDIIARLSAVFHDIGKPQTRSVTSSGVHFYRHEEVGAEMTKEIMKRLRYTNEEIESVSRIVHHHMNLKQAGKSGESASDKQLRKFAANLGDDLVSALRVIHADNISHSEHSSLPNQIPMLATRIEKLKANDGPSKVTLPITGHDVMKHLNIKPGPEVKKYLDAVREKMYEIPTLSAAQAFSIIDAIHQKSHIDLNATIVNPKTKNAIKIKSALRYPKTHPMYNLAIQYIKQHRKP